MSTTLLSEKIVAANRADIRVTLDPNTPNWQLYAMLGRVNYAINVRTATLLTAAQHMTDSDQLRGLIDEYASDIRQLNAEASAAVALLRSKQRRGFVARIPSPPASPATPPTVPVRHLDEFGNPLPLPSGAA